jgi:hypothetical protein
MAHYPDSQFLYDSVVKKLAAQKTAIIKSIMELPHYRKMFDVHIDPDKRGSEHFRTTAGGEVIAAGAGGSIVGFSGGHQSANRFSGAIIMDDMHDPDEVLSETKREKVVNNFSTVIQQRVRNPRVPFIFVGQVTHEEDLPNRLKKGLDGKKWEVVSLPSLDENGHALNPNVHPKEDLLILKETQPYVFAAQHQQCALPAGGGILKPDWFPELVDEPKILASFITADTAETADEANDPSVFSFWGLYKIVQHGVETDIYGLHWIACVQIWVEPCNLEQEFLQFYTDCCRHSSPPQAAAIERHSTGVTLLSVLEKTQGLQIIPVRRLGGKKDNPNEKTEGKSKKDRGCKTARYLNTQSYAATKRITFTRGAKHVEMCKNHLKQITANGTERWDDIADTYYDGVKLGLMDDVISKLYVDKTSQKQDKVAEAYLESYNRHEQIMRGNQ